MAIIGIDLGTSNSAAAVLRGGRPVMIPSAEGVSLGGKAFPSYVAVLTDGQIIVGEPARRQMALNPEGTATAFKRKMGQRITLKVHGRDYSPEQLSGFLLQKIKRDAEAFLGEPVTKAVVTVPAYFDDNQRSATKDACKIAGLDVQRLVNEPTAAALAYGLDRVGQELRVVVIDLGGGTLDVTIMEFGKGVFEVKATSGDTQLGGTDMDQKLFDHLATRFERQYETSIRNDIKAVARLKEAAEIAKIELSTNSTTKISLPYLSAGRGGAYHFEMELSRTELERIIAPIIERCKAPVEQALRDGGFTPQKIDRIIFVGGPTRMPVVRTFFENIFGRKAEMGVDPMECVAAGAAIQAGVLGGEVGDIVLVDVTPLTLGVETMGGIVAPLISRNTPIPTKHSETFTTAADMQTAVTIHIVQGERPMAADNTSLGQFNLEGLAPAPRGLPKVEVTFDLDASGVLDAVAKDTATGKTQSIRITGSTRLSESDKKRMLETAQQYAEEDKKRRDEAEKLNSADSSCYQAEKLLADLGDRVPGDKKDAINSLIRETREALSKRDVSRAVDRSEALKKSLQEVGAELYSKAAATQPSVEPNGQPKGDNVVDAQFRDDKKEGQKKAG